MAERVFLSCDGELRRRASREYIWMSALVVLPDPCFVSSFFVSLLSCLCVLTLLCILAHNFISSSTTINSHCISWREYTTSYPDDQDTLLISNSLLFYIPHYLVYISVHSVQKSYPCSWPPLSSYLPINIILKRKFIYTRPHQQPQASAATCTCDLFHGLTTLLGKTVMLAQPWLLSRNLSTVFGRKSALASFSSRSSPKKTSAPSVSPTRPAATWSPSVSSCAPT